MPINRRDFLRTTAAAAAVAGGRAVTGAPVTSAFAAPLIAAPRAEAFVEELALEALNAAKDAGASYADARIGRYRRQGINTRERQVTNVSDSESYGLGVRALVGGSWGFAATSTMTKEGVVAADGSFSIYEDDGASFAYRRNVYARIPIRWDDRSGTLTIGPRQGGYPGMAPRREIRVRWMTPGRALDLDGTVDASLTYSGEAVAVRPGA